MGTRLPRTTTRRRALRRLAAAALAVPFVAALAAMLRRERARQAPIVVAIPADVPAGLSVVESVVVYRGTDGTVRAFSARCTHLGCHIDRVVADEAVCPCHGSRYRTDGSVASGPATRPLAPLRLESQPSGGWIARLS